MPHDVVQVPSRHVLHHEVGEAVGLAGIEGAHVTSRKLRERLWHEILTNVSIRVEGTGSVVISEVDITVTRGIGIGAQDLAEHYNTALVLNHRYLPKPLFHREACRGRHGTTQLC